MSINELECCGVVELNDISHLTPGEAVRKVLRYGELPDFRVVIFTQAIDHGNGNYEGSVPENTYGENLAAYIKANQLGTVVKAPTGISPNTGNHITAYLWRLSDQGLYKWAREQGMNHIKRRPRKDERW